MYTGYEILWPFYVIYGVALAIITISCQELHGFRLFAECMILVTVIKWVAGSICCTAFSVVLRQSCG